MTNLLRTAACMALLATASLAATAQEAEQSKNDPGDRNVTLQIRRDVERDRSLSTDAHNIKIIVVHGTATLKGAVRSDTEKQAVLGYAQQHAGNRHVIDQLAVEPK